MSEHGIWFQAVSLYCIELTRRLHGISNISKVKPPVKILVCCEVFGSLQLAVVEFLKVCQIEKVRI